MKTQTHPNRMVRGAWLIALLLGGIFIIPALRAQPAARKVGNRFLLVFDTSADMKHRLPAVQKALNSVLAADANGQLHANDSLGVWTFDQELRAGQFPLQRWKPDYAATIVSNITTFVGAQRYAKKTSFDALMPSLNQVMRSSERLTVVIFCDGNGEIHGTPYDAGINKIFQQRQGERQKARLPIAIVMRSQHGEYVDCVVSFPPQPVSFPAFPPLLEAAPAPPKLTPAPRPSVPPLIIIGTPPTNRVPPVLKPAPTNPPPMTVTSIPAPAVANEVKPPDDMSLMRTGGVSGQLKINAALLPETNAVTPPSEGSGMGRKGVLALGMAFLAVAGGLAGFMFGRIRSVKKS